jgi:Aminopeptidase C
MILGAGACAFAGNKDKGTLIEAPKGGFYDDVIMKDVKRVNDSLSPEAPKLKFVMDQKGLDLPNKVNLYKRYWANAPISQGAAGTCWDFCTTSFFESEIFRQNGKKVKLSEMYNAYWEYVDKARRFVQQRGNSEFSQGSQSNALVRLTNKYGLVPQSAYAGILNGRIYHTHSAMYAEMNSYLESVKKSSSWNEEQVIATIRSILNHYMGEPPVKFKVDGKEYNPVSYMKEYLKLNTNDYVDILSYKQKPFWKQAEYEVDDNWWHSQAYYNIPLDDYMKTVKQAIRDGYTVAIGGDTSEPGFSRETQCAMIPDFDIPTAYINDDARQFRFSNKTTTDDHGMHLVGYVENYNGDGKDWFLIKDSGAGSKNNDPKAPEFGYYFFSEDYFKLKMMSFTVHKDAVKELLTKFK